MYVRLSNKLDTPQKKKRKEKIHKKAFCYIDKKIEVIYIKKKEDWNINPKGVIAKESVFKEKGGVHFNENDSDENYHKNHYVFAFDGNRHWCVGYDKCQYSSQSGCKRKNAVYCTVTGAAN